MGPPKNLITDGIGGCWSMVPATGETGLVTVRRGAVALGPNDRRDGRLQ